MIHKDIFHKENETVEKPEMLSDDEMESVSGGHVVIVSQDRKHAYRIDCRQCGSRNVRFVGKYLNLNEEVDSTGMFAAPWNTIFSMERGTGEWPMVCNDCGAEFNIHKAHWQEVYWKDYTDQ